MFREHKFYVLLEAEGSDLQSDEMIFQGTLENLYMENAIKDALVSKSKSQRLDLRRIREDFDVIQKDEPVFFTMLVFLSARWRNMLTIRPKR
ncbi:MAG: hypothetical protein CMP95_00615 [Gammaproteobacteria bacterium]|nr:hypothetical protein [Gammaproteobacteria bacterium]